MRTHHCTGPSGRGFLGLSLGLSVLLLAGCFGDNPQDEGRVTPPVLDSLGTYLVQPGDTITLWGREFAPVPGDNRILFNNILAAAVPFAGGSDRLDAVVPADAATGPVWVEKQGTRSNGIPLEVVRAIGEVWIFASSSAEYSFKVPVESQTEGFLVIPHSATQEPGTYSYLLTPGDASVVPSPPQSSRSREPTRRPSCPAGRLGEWAAEILGRDGDTGARPFPVHRAPAAPQDTMTFYVLNTTSPSVPVDPGDFTAVDADLKYTGRRCYIYQDLEAPAGGFDAADFEYFGNLFDGTIYPVDSTNYGPPTDIDNNGKVVILFTPVVNGLTPPGTAQDGFYTGFFSPSDLLPDDFPPGTSNGMEIFYAIVPDPGGDFGNVFSTAKVKEVVPPTLAHELEHMISYGFRIFHYGTNYIQARWLEEGMAHMAEDLVGLNQSNIARANRYLPDPGAVPLMGEDVLEQRGAIYLLLRYLADRLGTGILRGMVESSKVGTDTIELVAAEDFFITFADWLATLYLSGRGITSDTKYSYTSIDLRDTGTFVPLGVSARDVSDGAVADAVSASAGDFFEIFNPTPPGLELSIGGTTQSARIRLVVVRIQ